MKQIRKVMSVLVGLLREISDQNAYHRHLTLHRRLHSREEWQQFQDKRLRSRYVRPKCC